MPASPNLLSYPPSSGMGWFGMNPVQVGQLPQGWNSGLTFNNPLSSVGSFGSNGQANFNGVAGWSAGPDTNLGNLEAREGIGTQTPTNVLDVRGQLQPLLNSYGSQAKTLAAIKPNLGRISLSQDYAGPNEFQNQLSGGIDYFGNLGISEGMQNIALQRNAANAELARTLGRIPGNNTILGVLQNQNLFKSMLAGNPLISQAQKDTASRVEQQINLQNALTQMINQTRLQQGSYNQQAQLAELQARLGLMQPQQNMLEILSNLQGQARGVTTRETQRLGRNFS